LLPHWAAAIGTGIFEKRTKPHNCAKQNQTLQQQQAPLAAQIRQLQHEFDGAKQQLTSLEAEK